MSLNTTLLNDFLTEEGTPHVAGMLHELLRTRTHGTEDLTLDTFHVTLDFDTYKAHIADQRGSGHTDTVSLPDLQDALEVHRSHPWA